MWHKIKHEALGREDDTVGGSIARNKSPLNPHHHDAKHIESRHISTKYTARTPSMGKRPLVFIDRTRHTDFSETAAVWLLHGRSTPLSLMCVNDQQKQRLVEEVLSGLWHPLSGRGT